MQKKSELKKQLDALNEETQDKAKLNGETQHEALLALSEECIRLFPDWHYAYLKRAEGKCYAIDDKMDRLSLSIEDFADNYELEYASLFEDLEFAVKDEKNEIAMRCGAIDIEEYLETTKMYSENIERVLLLEAKSVDDIICKVSCFDLENKYDEAMRLLEPIIHDDPDNLEALGWCRCIFSVFNKNLEKALYYNDRLIALEPNKADHYLFRGKKMLSLDKSLVAIEAFKKAYEIDSDCSEAQYNLKETYKKIDKPYLAIEYYSRVIELNPNEANYYCDRASVYKDLSEYEKAVEDYSRAIELNPNETGYYFGRASVYEHLSEYEKVIEDYKKRISINPKSCFSFNDLALIYKEIDKPYLAIEYFSKAIDIYQNNADFFSNRACVYQSISEYEKAVEDLSKAIEINPNEVDYYFKRATAYEQLSWDKAVEDYKIAISIDSEYLPAIKNLAILSLVSGHPDFASVIEYSSRVIELDPSESLLYCYRGIAYEHFSEFDKAIEDYRKGISINPEEIGCLACLARYYEKNDKPKLAIDYFSKAIELNSNEADYYYERGRIYLCVSEKEKAIADFKEALRIDSRCRLAINSLAEIYKELGEYPLAIDYVSKVIELDPRYSYNYIDRAELYLRNSDNEKAMADYKECLSLDSQNECSVLASIDKVWYEVESYLTIKDRCRQPNEFYNHIVESLDDEAKSNLYYYRANDKLSDNDNSSAIECFTQAIVLNPSNSNAYSKRGWVKILEGNLAEALLDCNKAIEINGHPFAHHNRGDLYQKKQEYYKAIVDYTCVIATNVYYIDEAYESRGDVHNILKNYEAALYDYKMTLNMNSDNKTVLDKIVNVENKISS